MMEHSSPLAAMQPPSIHFGHCFRSDAPTSYPTMGSMNSFVPNTFNFKDLSMKKSSSDYFNTRPVRGSSPAASLAADLSQNFHIDQSPQLPTPRRSLFSGNLFAMVNREAMTTPPLPSSSPGVGFDTMDISMEASPLPHKAPYHVHSIQLQSPSPEMTPSESPMLTISQASPLESSRVSLFQERRKGTLRPPLSRTKNLSASSIPSQLSQEARSPPFKFSTSMTKLSKMSSNLSEMFVESPPRGGRSPKSFLMGPPRPRPSMGGVSVRGNGSPASGHIRKSSNPSVRPRKQFRRSLSMFEHANDVVDEQPYEPSGLNSVMDLEEPHTLQIPHFIPEDQPDSLPRIEKSTMCDILDGKFQDKFDKVLVVDCRFEYEYEGGHIDGALNYNDKEELAAELFNVGATPNTLLVFHCEYSAHRAPLMAKHIRHKDRAVNVDCYPQLTYPEMYILDGGYSSFYADHGSRCFPQNYVEMDSKEHEFACERGLGKVKARSKLVRAQTFAFGQPMEMEDSPTAPRCRRQQHDKRGMMDLDFSLGRSIESPRQPNRRMFSY